MRDQESAGRGESREDEALGDQLLQEPATVGADCDANGHFMAAWKESAGVVEWRLPQGPELDAAPAVGCGEDGFQSVRNGGNFLLGLLESYARLESYVGLNPTCAAIFEFVSAALKGFFHRGGNPELHAPAYEGAQKPLWSDTDDGVLDAVEALRLADDGGIAFEAALP